MGEPRLLIAVCTVFEEGSWLSISATATICLPSLQLTYRIHQFSLLRFWVISASLLSWIVSFIGLLSAQCCDDCDLSYGVAVSLVILSINIEIKASQIWITVEVNWVVRYLYLNSVSRDVQFHLLVVYSAAGCKCATSGLVQFPRPKGCRAPMF